MEMDDLNMQFDVLDGELFDNENDNKVEEEEPQFEN